MHWPDGEVQMPNYLSRFRGVRGVGRWLDRWASETLTYAGRVHVLAYILGGAALPYAPELCGRITKAVILRSPFQEAVPRALCARLGRWGTAALFGQAVADLGAGPFWPPGFALSCPTLVLLETRPSRAARRLAVPPLSDTALQIGEYREVPIDHDAAYQSPVLMRAAVDWLRSPAT
jgi:hypothetical protein